MNHSLSVDFGALMGSIVPSSLPKVSPPTMKEDTPLRENEVKPEKQKALQASLLEPQTESVTTFPVDVFPKKIAEIANAFVENEGFNVDFLCGSMLTVFATAMGNLWEARFSATLHLSPIIYMVIIGPPSSGKTPPLRQVEKPLQELDMESDEAYRRAREEYDRIFNMTTQERLQQQVELPSPPHHKEMLVINTTIEQLFGILSHNPHGVLMFVNELNALVSNMNRYGKGSDEAYWLEFFDGNQVKYERKSNDEYISILHPYVSIIGGTQPGLLPKMFGGERATSGFTSRFLKVFPDITTMPRWKHGSMPQVYIDEWNRIIRQVATMDHTLDTNGEVVPRSLEFSKEAKDILYDWEEGIAQKWSEVDDYMQGVCGKLKTYVIRFCLIIHVMRMVCMETSSEEIDEVSVKSACRLADYFLTMDQRVNNLISKRPVDEVHQQFFDKLPENFTTAEAISLGKLLDLSDRTVKRFLKDGRLGCLSGEEQARHLHEEG